MNKYQIEDAVQRRKAEEILVNPGGPDDLAWAYLTLGLIGEHESDWEAAIANYTLALTAEPQDTKIRYFSNNNLGYSLIQLGRFDEAEEYCETAIEIDEKRHNAHKNLGLIYQGQGRWLDAAFCFVSATWRAPGDQRALIHLRQLLEMRPQLTAQSEDLKKELERVSLMFEHCEQVTVH